MLPDRVQRLFEPGSHAMALARLFSDAGHELFLVGGSVRDAILDRPHDDLDFATDARPETIKEVVGSWAQNLFTAGERQVELGVGVIDEAFDGDAAHQGLACGAGARQRDQDLLS